MTTPSATERFFSLIEKVVKGFEKPADRLATSLTNAAASMERDPLKSVPILVDAYRDLRGDSRISTWIPIAFCTAGFALTLFGVFGIKGYVQLTNNWSYSMIGAGSTVFFAGFLYLCIEGCKKACVVSSLWAVTKNKPPVTSDGDG